MSKPATKTVNCPSCQKEVAWLEENKYRPFCSKRCKLIDFGDWAAENHIIPGKRVSTEDDENQETLQYRSINLKCWADTRMHIS